MMIAGIVKARHGSEKQGSILWLTGLSGSGKSTLAGTLSARVAPAGKVEVLDGDDVRLHLSKGLGFSREDRDTNVRRIGFVARLLARHEVCVIVAAISPYAATRLEVRQLAETDGIPFFEVFVDASIDALIQRDVKGLYRRAIAGEIPHFTGISDPYERPLQPDVTVHTDSESIDTSTRRILQELVKSEFLPLALLHPSASNL
jgi:adenylyl-sulfate kinase